MEVWRYPASVLVRAMSWRHRTGLAIWDPSPDDTSGANSRRSAKRRDACVEVFEPGLASFGLEVSRFGARKTRNYVPLFSEFEWPFRPSAL